MIFQEPMTSLNPAMTCGNQIMESILRHKKVKREQAKKDTLQFIREVRLPEPERIFKSWPHQLSGGQRQRIMIAMALSTRPELLIADEPTTALDVTVQKDILELLRSLGRKYKLSVMFITHESFGGNIWPPSAINLKIAVLPLGVCSPMFSSFLLNIFSFMAFPSA